MQTGGFGEFVTRTCLDHGYTVPVFCFSVKDEYIQHGDHERLMKEAGLDTTAIAETIKGKMKGEQAFG